MAKISMVIKINCHGGKKLISMLAQINFQGSKSDFHAVKINFYCGKNQYPRW